MNDATVLGSNAQLSQSTTDGTMALATTRQAQEVQAAMIVAKNFPRDETQALSRILRSCQRQGLAECAMYSYPRGATKVTGPSIRLAEAMAQAWGNIDYGVIELEQKAGESVCMAYAWDLETNTRRQMIFNAPHKIGTKQGMKLLTDPRDIYEMVANQGARRVRACILGVIPGDVQDEAIAACNKTLAHGGGKPLSDRIRGMIIAFQEFGVTQEMLEGRVGYKSTAWSEHDFVGLKKVYTSIRDGIGTREDFFRPAEPEKPKPQSRSESVKQQMQPGDVPEVADLPPEGSGDSDLESFPPKEVISEAVTAPADGKKKRSSLIDEPNQYLPH